MLISISGAQSQGKSKILDSLEKEYGYTVIPQKTSRSILHDWGFQLWEINSYKKLTKKFQEEVFKRHLNNLLEVKKIPGVKFQERSMADVAFYALNILGPFNEYNDFINNYFEKCKEVQNNYDLVIYISGRKNYTGEDDNVRSINKHFISMADIMIKKYVEDFSKNILYVDTPDHNQRIKIILDKIEKL